MGGNPLGLLVLVAPPVPSFGGGKGEGEGEGEGNGGRAPSPCPIRTPHGGGATPLWAALPLPCSPCGPLLPRGVPVTSQYSDKYPKHSGTILVSEHYRPIYQSLPLDHFETPHHVRDLIRDSEQYSVIKSHNSNNINRHRTLSVWTLRVRELCRHDRDTSPVNKQ